MEFYRVQNFEGAEAGRLLIDRTGGPSFLYMAGKTYSLVQKPSGEPWKPEADKEARDG